MIMMIMNGMWMVISGPVMVFNSCVVTKLTSVVERGKWMDG